jgi:hypothetical protein
VVVSDLGSGAMLLISLIRSGEEVEKCLDLYLKIPGLSKEDVATAMLARSNARMMRTKAAFVSAKLCLAKLETDIVQAGGQLRCKEVSATV